MAKILIFIYALIIFLSLFLVVTSRTRVPCISESDCPEGTAYKLWQCIDGFCDITVREGAPGTGCILCPKCDGADQM
ncbi:ubiquitin-protein ligase E3 Brl2 [Trifolium repens]|nr:ubiquitin-protein ligase E3 Brl2 [Trifolium repens]